MTRYAELNAKTCFSFLRGASQPEELIRQARHLGISALGIADRDGVYGIPKAYFAKKEFPDLKLIVGADVSLAWRERVSLIARDRRAYGLLCRILTASHEGREKGQAELGWDRLIDFLSRPESQGLIAIPEIANGEPGCEGAVAEERLETLCDFFGRYRLFLPLRRFRDGRDRKRAETALALSKRLDVRLVATNDVHCHVPERRPLQDIMTAIRSGKPLVETGYGLFQNSERHLKSPEQMIRLFREFPDAIAATTDIADSCTFCPSELRYRYPSEWIPAGHSAQSYLEELVKIGARDRYPGGVPDNVNRLLRYELTLIAKLGFADYFLTIYEIVDFARSKKILCQGRGSAANSIVCYCLGITAIDPVRMELLFERFISEERGEPPDIDVDFEHERREEVIQHIYEKYGRDRAAMVSAVVTYRRRSAFREVSKALGVEVGTLSAAKLQREFEAASARTGIPDCEKVAERLAEEMDGFPRHLSIHSGGFTLSADPIIEIVPVEPARMEGRTIIQWDKYDLDYLGLLKVDVLSLGMLSALRRSLELVGKSLYEIPENDGKTYAMIQKADTVGTFQIESRAQMNMLGRLKPKNFYDLVIEVAIVRPGPVVGKMVHPYLKRRRGLEPVEFPDERLRAILGKTLGVPLFQEQVMKMAISLAGFTPGEADELRRAIGAWRSSGSIEKMGRRLMDGLLKSGLPPEFAQRIFDQIQGFSMYGFPESHSASFALLAYASSYLKCHHPAEFLCGLLNSQPMGFYATHTLVDDARRAGVKVLPVHPQFSQNESELVAEKTLRMGLCVVDGLSKSEIEKWLKTREERPFSDLADFLSRTNLRLDVLERLALGDAFECFGYDQRHALWKILELRSVAMLAKDSVQLDLFSAAERPLSEGRAEQRAIFNPLNLSQAIREDYEAYGMSTKGHPMEGLRERIPSLPKQKAAEIKKMPNGRMIQAAGLLLLRQRPPTAKGVCFGTLEDESGFLDLILHPDIFERYREAFLTHSFLRIRGLLQRDANTVSIIVKHLEPIPDLSSSWNVQVSTYFNPMNPT